MRSNGCASDGRNRRERGGSAGRRGRGEGWAEERRRWLGYQGPVLVWVGGWGLLRLRSSWRLAIECCVRDVGVGVAVTIARSCPRGVERGQLAGCCVALTPPLTSQAGLLGRLNARHVLECWGDAVIRGQLLLDLKVRFAQCPRCQVCAVGLAPIGLCGSVGQARTGSGVVATAGEVRSDQEGTGGTAFAGWRVSEGAGNNGSLV